MHSSMDCTSNQSDFQTPDRRNLLDQFRSRTTALRSEIQQLETETQLSVDNNQQYTALSKVAKDLSEQTTDLRNYLEDFNMARMNSFRSVTELKKEIDDLRAHNQQLQSTIDQLQLEKRRKEERIDQLESGSSNDKRTVDSSPEEKMIFILQTQLNQIRDPTSSSNIQRDALSLIDQISTLECELDQLTDDDQDLQSTQELEQCLADIHQLQQTNLSLLSSVSQTLVTRDSSQLSIHSNSTDILAEQHRKLKQDFHRLENLDQRLITESHELKIQLSRMQEGIRKYNDLESLKHQADRRKSQLTIDKLHINQRRQITQMEIKTLQSQFDTLHTQLHHDPTHQQLVDLEDKLRTLSRIDPSDDHPSSIKHQVLTLVHAHNQWLIQRLKDRS